MSANLKEATCQLAIIFLLICCNCVIIPRARSEESPSTSTLSSSIEPTTTSTDRVIPTRPYPHTTSSSSSSSSVEDQLTPLLLGNGGGSNNDPKHVCVTCPQTVCSLSKVSYERKTIHHNWRVDGLPDYITYLEKFQTPFEVTSNVRFNTTPPNDGNWTFVLSRSGSRGGVYNYFLRETQPSTYQLDSDSENDVPALKLTVTYVTESTIPPRLSFDLWLSAHIEDDYVTLPSQICSHPASFDNLTTGGRFLWTYVLAWANIQTQLQSLIETEGHESQSVIFKFVINSYQDGSASTTDANCYNWNNGNEVGDPRPLQRPPQSHHLQNPHQGSLYEPNPTNNATWPPFLHQMYAIVKDDKYTDLTVKSGDDEFQIHRVIAAYSSPILATMIFNKTYEKSESLLDFGEDIGSDVVEELIRYMYTGRVEDIDEIADRLIVAATQYGFPALKKQCESVLIKQVKTENAFNMYELGVEVGSMRLKRRAFNIMKENKSKIVAQSEEFRKLSVHHPDVMYELFLS